MVSRGLDLWKGDMKRLLKSMATHERDFATRDKLDMLCETVREFMERAFALELAVWRTSLAQQLDGDAPSRKDAPDHESSMSEDGPSPSGACAYRSNRRIMCGSDVIVRDVIPFLENEPVEQTIRKIVGSYAPLLSN